MDYSLLRGVPFWMYVPFLAYVVLQVYAPIRCKGWWRGAALVPLPFMIHFVWCIMNVHLKAWFFWPLYLILVSALLAYLAALVLVQRCTGWRRGAALVLMFLLGSILVGWWISIILRLTFAPADLIPAIHSSAVFALPLALLVLAYRSGRRRAREGTGSHEP